MNVSYSTELKFFDKNGKETLDNSKIEYSEWGNLRTYKDGRREILENGKWTKLN